MYDHLQHAQKVSGSEHWRPPLNGNPTWTETVNKALQKLIRSCWHREAMGRPEFEEIYTQLDALSRERRVMVAGGDGGGKSGGKGKGGDGEGKDPECCAVQ